MRQEKKKKRIVPEDSEREREREGERGRPGTGWEAGAARPASTLLQEKLTN